MIFSTTKTFGIASFAALVLTLPVCPADASSPSWVFARSTFSHDPATGARVAQYQRVAPVEDLDDPRAVTSRYRRTRSTLRGPDGSIDSTFEVQNYSSGNGGLDAEWERFHDAWRQSLLSGSYYYQNQPAPTGSVYGYPGDGFNPTYGPALPNGGYGDPRFANPFPPRGAYGPAPFDGRFEGPNVGQPGFRQPGFGQPGFGGFPYGGFPGVGFPNGRFPRGGFPGGGFGY